MSLQYLHTKHPSQTVFPTVLLCLCLHQFGHKLPVALCQNYSLLITLSFLTVTPRDHDSQQSITGTKLFPVPVLWMLCLLITTQALLKPLLCYSGLDMCSSHVFLYSLCSTLSFSCLLELMKSVRCSSIHSTFVSARIEGEKGVRFLRQCKETEDKKRAESDLQRRLLISTRSECQPLSFGKWRSLTREEPFIRVRQGALE